MDLLSEQTKMEDYMMKHIEHAEIPNGIYIKMNPSFYCCSFSKKSLTLSYPIQKWEYGTEDCLHNGLLFTAFDSTFGMLSFYFSNKTSVTTVNLSIHYLKPIQENNTLLVSGTIISQTDTLLTIEGKAFLLEKKQFAANAYATFMKLGTRKLVKEVKK